MRNEMKNDQSNTVQTNANQGKRELSLPKVVTGLRAGQASLAHAMPPPGV